MCNLVFLSAVPRHVSLLPGFLSAVPLPALWCVQHGYIKDTFILYHFIFSVVQTHSIFVNINI